MKELAETIKFTKKEFEEFKTKLVESARATIDTETNKVRVIKGSIINVFKEYENF